MFTNILHFTNLLSNFLFSDIVKEKLKNMKKIFLLIKKYWCLFFDHNWEGDNLNRKCMRECCAAEQHFGGKTRNGRIIWDNKKNEDPSKFRWCSVIGHSWIKVPNSVNEQCVRKNCVAEKHSMIDILGKETKEILDYNRIIDS